MILRNLVLSFFILAFCFATPYGDTQGKSLKILFVGNSLTYVNDLPALITEIGKQDGITISYTSFLLPDYSLEDHWNEGKAASEIENNRYDFVIAQQGPSALPESQVLLLEYAKRFAEVCNKNRSKLALYMVWPSKARSFDLDNVISSYTKAAEKTSSLLCPAGLAWKYAWQADSMMPLYSSDNFHPSVTGSVLSALTIYGRLTNKNDFDFIQYDNCTWKKDISEEKLKVLKKAALKAIGK
ncbi:MAG: SGNH/GDSL hydrolase family protein [Bacteroidota bacterium]